MKKNKIILFVLMLFCTLAILSACDNGQEHKHELFLHEAKESTCIINGNDPYYECKKCHELFLDSNGQQTVDKESITKPLLAHTPMSEWIQGDYEHYHRCKVCGFTINETKEEHEYAEDDICLVCGQNRQCELLYEFDEEKGTYSIYTMRTGFKNLIIPDTYNDIPVTDILEGGFGWCHSLINVKIGSNITNIGNAAFDQCENLQKLEIADGLISVGIGAFGRCSSLSEITLPNSIESLGIGTFGYCSSLSDITLPNKIKRIEEYTFEHCGNLQSVTIGKGIMSIENYAFRGCDNLKEIYYFGTPEEWNKIDFHDGNEELISSKRYFYSLSDPRHNEDYNSEYNYWHYDNNGEILVWKN